MSVDSRVLAALLVVGCADRPIDLPVGVPVQRLSDLAVADLAVPDLAAPDDLSVGHPDLLVSDLAGPCPGGCPAGSACIPGCDGGGRCEAVPDGCPTTPTDPVCGCFGLQFPNDCQRRLGHVGLQQAGLCPNRCQLDSDCGDGGWCCRTPCDPPKCDPHACDDNWVWWCRVTGASCY